MWRDSRYAFGALTIGVISDYVSVNTGFYFIATVMFVSGALIAGLMYETALALRKVAPSWQGNPSFTVPRSGHDRWNGIALAVSCLCGRRPTTLNMFSGK